jgi:hypothetical protein
LSLLSSDYVLDQIKAEANSFTNLSNRQKVETRDELRKESVTKIHGQPTDQDITALKKELITIAASIPTGLGGGNHGHA